MLLWELSSVGFISQIALIVHLRRPGAGLAPLTTLDLISFTNEIKPPSLRVLTFISQNDRAPVKAAGQHVWPRRPLCRRPATCSAAKWSIQRGRCAPQLCPNSPRTAPHAPPGCCAGSAARRCAAWPPSRCSHPLRRPLPWSPRRRRQVRARALKGVHRCMHLRVR